MPLQATSGAASYDAFGGGVPVVPNYIEDVFSTYLYTGTGAAQTITNGIDLSTFGGLVWLKYRSGSAGSIYHHLYDSARGKSGNASYNYIYSNQPDPQGTGAYGPTSFNTNGFTLNTYLTESTIPYVSWTWRKQPKFFDVVTWTGTGSNRTISHNLGSVPACIMVKRTDTTGAWQVYHRSLANTEYLVLNTTDAKATGTTRWNSTTPTSTVFSLGTDATVNASGGTYVAYIFAHDAGGFGLTGTDNVISCGSFVGTGSDLSVNLGYEPQWLLVKRASSGTENWAVYDNMRGMFVNYDDNILFPNTSGAEVQVSRIAPTATGFSVASSYPASGTTYIYIAIRRGPMKVPTSGTSVFDADTLTPAANLTGTKVTNPFAMDFLINTQRSHAGLASTFVADRLRGGSAVVFTNSTSAESNLGSTYNYKLDYNDGFVDNVAYYNGTVTTPMIYWSFKRAPSFFDVVCWDGNSSGNRALTHNLGIAPEMMIMKSRNTAGTNWQWWVFHKDISNTPYPTNMTLNSNEAAYVWGSTINTPTTTTFTVGSSFGNTTGNNFVAYLFATCAGVSKCTSFTGTGTLQTIDCGFTAGSRFVLIKRTDSTGDWYVWDSSRGLSSSTDPYLLLNSTAAEVTSTNWVDTTSTGFQVTAASGNNVNINGASYIAMAIA